MKHKTFALRLYFHRSATVKPTRRLHRFFKPALSTHLLRSASQAGIQQAVFHSVHGGYLPGGKLRFNHLESSHAEVPHCIELIDVEHKLREFWHRHAEHMAHVRAIFLPCETA
jgi:PII-like signaling protein